MMSESKQQSDYTRDPERFAQWQSTPPRPCDNTECLTLRVEALAPTGQLVLVETSVPQDPNHDCGYETVRAVLDALRDLEQRDSTLKAPHAVIQFVATLATMRLRHRRKPHRIRASGY